MPQSPLTHPAGPFFKSTGSRGRSSSQSPEGAWGFRSELVRIEGTPGVPPDVTCRCTPDIPLPPWGSWSCWGETGCQPSGLGRWLIPPGLQVPIPKLFPTWGMRHSAGNLTAFHITSCRKRLVWELGKGWCAGVALTPSFHALEVPLFDRGPLCLWPRPLPLSASHAGSEPWEAEPALSWQWEGLCGR